MSLRFPFTIKFGIARKFLIASLTLAIVPLLVAAWLEARSVSQLGAELAADSGKTINQRTRRTLEQTAGHYAGIINRQSRTIELLARLHAKHATTAMTDPSVFDRQERKIPWANFSAAQSHETLAAELPANQYFDVTDNEPFETLLVASTQQSFFSVIKPPSEDVRHSAFRLLQVNPFYLDIQRHHKDLFYWQYVALENGLLATFPGHADYPADFDPRQRAWYLAQKKERRILRSPRHTDAATGIPMINITMPILDESGDFLGVAGMDVNLSGLLNTLQLPLKTEYDSRVVLSVLNDDVKTNQPDIFIVAQSEREKSKDDWRDRPDIQSLKLDDQGDMQKIIDDVKAGRNGYLRTSWQGEDFFCLYEPLRLDNSMLMLFVPTNNLLNPALQSAKHALTSTERYVNTLLPFAAGLILVIVALAYASSRRFVQPIHALVEAINKVGNGDLNTRVDIRTGDELEQLGDAFNAVIPQLKEHTKTQQELSVARAVQQRLLPHETPSFAGIEIFGHTLYADQTGGDYYDFLDLSTHATPKIGIVLGDVAGHGVAAAFMMATVRALLHGSSNTIESPAAVLNHINSHLADDLHAGQFMTLIYLLYDAENRSLQWADAGHDPAIVYSPADDRFSELSGEDIPLGVDSEWVYREDSDFKLKANDVVLLGTDGIWETKSPNGEQFGKERLKNILRDKHECSVEEICNAVLAAIDKFRDGLEQRDDVSIVVFRARPPTQSVVQ